MRISVKFMIFPLLINENCPHESRKRNWAHKINKERVAITSGTMILFKYLIALCRQCDAHFVEAENCYTVNQ